jgi:hypothetical protein
MSPVADERPAVIDDAPAVRRRTAGKPSHRPAHGRGRFSEADMLEKLEQWTVLYGAPPTTNDWEPSRARRAKQHWRADRFLDGDWPTAGMVRRRFGTFNDAVRRAGLIPRAAPSRGKAPLRSPDEILMAMVEWRRRYGAPPTQTDWDVVRARQSGQLWRVVRYEAGDWPSFNTVRYHFGSMSRAAQAAGVATAASSTRRAVRRRPPENDRLTDAVRAVASARRDRDRDRERRALVELSRAALHAATTIQAPEEEYR